MKGVDSRLSNNVQYTSLRNCPPHNTISEQKSRQVYLDLQLNTEQSTFNRASITTITTLQQSDESEQFPKYKVFTWSHWLIIVLTFKLVDEITIQLQLQPFNIQMNLTLRKSSHWSFNVDFTEFKLVDKTYTCKIANNSCQIGSREILIIISWKNSECFILKCEPSRKQRQPSLQTLCPKVFFTFAGSGPGKRT